MTSEYVEERNDAYYVRGTGVPLDSVIHGYRQGHSPETIRENFPFLKLGQVYGAIAFYLDNRAVVDEYLERQRWDEEEQNAVPLRAASPDLWEFLERARREQGLSEHATIESLLPYIVPGPPEESEEFVQFIYAQRQRDALGSSTE